MSNGQMLTEYHAKYFAYELTKRCPSDSLEKLSSTLSNAQVDLNPHQIEAALFAFRSPLSKGAMTVEQLDKIHEEMKRGESLLICAKSFAPPCKERHNNITIKKIPQMVLGKCEFAKDNYDLNIINVPKENEGMEQ